MKSVNLKKRLFNKSLLTTKTPPRGVCLVLSLLRVMGTGWGRAPHGGIKPIYPPEPAAPLAKWRPRGGRGAASVPLPAAGLIPPRPLPGNGALPSAQQPHFLRRLPPPGRAGCCWYCCCCCCWCWRCCRCCCCCSEGARRAVSGAAPPKPLPPLPSAARREGAA